MAQGPRRTNLDPAARAISWVPLRARKSLLSISGEAKKLVRFDAG
jgi:hypothetical protein